MYNCFRIVFFSLIIVFMGTGCASHYVVPGFDGDKRPSDQVGLLKVPENIKILRVNGKRLSRFLLNNLTLDYQLLPGGNRIEYQYAALWAIAGGSRENEKASSELVESKVQEVAFNVTAGTVYHFDFAESKTRAESKKVAENFQSTMVDSQNQVVARGVLYVDREKQAAARVKSLPLIDQAAAPTPVSNEGVASSTPAVTQGAVSEQDLTNMDALKMFWTRASVEEKKAFMKWAFK